MTRTGRVWMFGGSMLPGHLQYGRIQCREDRWIGAEFSHLLGVRRL
jgi:hypothetical protein